MPGISTDVMFQTALEQDGNLQAAANVLGLSSRSVIWGRLKNAGLLEELRARTGTTKVSSPKEKVEVRPRGNFTDVDYLGTQIQTEDELLKHAGIDMDLYEIERVVVNNWEVAGKKAKNQWEGVWKTGLRQIKITLRRKKDDRIAVERILAKIEAIQAGVMEAIMLNQEGAVAECTGDNIFIVRELVDIGIQRVKTVSIVKCSEEFSLHFGNAVFIELRS